MGEMAGTRDSLVDDGPGSTTPSNRVSGVVGVLQTIYGLVVLLSLAATVLALATKGSAHYPIAKWACAALGLEAYALTYLGLRLRKSWVVPLRKLPRQVDTSKVDFTGASGLDRNATGGTWPRLSWGRSVL